MRPEINKYLAKDPILAKAITHVTFEVHAPTISLYEHLTKSIVSQQLSVKAASTIYGRFRNIFPITPLNPEKVLATPLEAFRAVGLSQQKSTYIHNISSYFLENKLLNTDWHALSDEEIVEILLPIKGVGVWTIQMVLIFHLLRDDVFPVDDLAIRERMISWYQPEGDGKEKIKKLFDIAETWRPYRSWACRYIWAAGDQQPL